MEPASVIKAMDPHWRSYSGGTAGEDFINAGEQHCPQIGGRRAGFVAAWAGAGAGRRDACAGRSIGRAARAVIGAT